MRIMTDGKVILDFIAGNDYVISKFTLAEKIYTTVFDYALLMAGAYITQNTNHNLYIVKEFIKENVDILYFEKKEANTFARLKAKYLNFNELKLIKASVAITENLFFLTYDTEYKTVKELKIICLD